MATLEQPLDQPADTPTDDLRWWDYITMSANWFALTVRSQGVTPLILPLLVQQFVGDELKGTYYGILRLWTLMAAILFQALMGLLSDHSTSRFGRRKPFIVGGALFEVIILLLIGFTAGMSGLTGYWVLFGLMLLDMLGTNTAHAATQPLIADNVPDAHKGIASGVKAFLELPLPLIFISFVMGKLVEQGNIWGALIALCVVILVMMVVTLFAPDKPIKSAPKLDWQPFVRLVLMTAAFAAVILGAGWGVSFALRAAPGMGAAGGWLVGAAGLSAMLVAIGLGVFAATRISLGESARDNPSFVWWVVNRLMFLVGATNIASFLVFFLQEKFGYAPNQAAGPAAQAVLVVGVLILITALPSGWLADRMGKKTIVFVAALLGGLGIAFVLLTPGLGGLFTGAGLVGAALGFFYSANFALGTMIIPQQRAGHFLGVSNLAGAGAGAVGAYIGGPIADQYSYTLIILLYGIILLLSLVALAGIRVDKVD